MAWIVDELRPYPSANGEDAAGDAQPAGVVLAGARHYWGTVIVDTAGIAVDPCEGRDTYSVAANQTMPIAVGGQMALVLQGAAGILARITRWWVQEGPNAIAPPDTFWRLLRGDTLTLGPGTLASTPHHEPGAAVLASATIFPVGNITAFNVTGIFDIVTVPNSVWNRHDRTFGGFAGTMNGLHGVAGFAASPQMKQPIDVLGIGDAVGIHCATALPAAADYVMGLEWYEVDVT